MNKSDRSPERGTIGRPILAGALVLSLLMLAAGTLTAFHARDAVAQAAAGDAHALASAYAEHETVSEVADATPRVDALLRRANRATAVLERSRFDGAPRAAPGAAPALRPLGDRAAWFPSDDGRAYAVLARRDADAARVADAAAALAELEHALVALLDTEIGVEHLAVAVPGVGYVAAPGAEQGPDPDAAQALLAHLVTEPAAEPAWFTHLRAADGREDGMIRFVRPFYTRDGAPAGAAAADLVERDLAAALGGANDPALALVSPDGSIVAAMPAAMAALGLEQGASLEQCAAAFRPLLGGEEVLSVPSGGLVLSDARHHATLRPLTEAPWSAASLRPADDVTARAAAITARRSTSEAATSAFAVVLLVSGVLAVAVFAGAFLVVRMLTSRLGAIVKGAAQHAAGNLDHVIRADGDDELARVAVGLNSTAQRLRRTIGQLEEGERRLQSLIEHMGEGFVICDADDRIAFANKRFFDMLGQPTETVLGHYVEELILPESLERYRREAVQRRDRKASHYEIVWYGPDGHHSRSLVAGMPLYDPSGEYAGSYGVVTDITDREEAQQHTAKEEKLRALSEMAGAVAHDFNNHFTSIVGNAQFLLLDEHPAPVREALEIIEKAALESTRLVRRMREFTKPRSLERGATVASPNAVLERALEATRLRFAADARRRGITFEVMCETASHRPIRCHEGELEEALQNVIANGLEAMPEGGSIELAVFDRGEDAVAFRITDAGCGIDLDNERKIFDPFFTTKINEDARSTGLGLSIAYGIVRAHRGRIDVRSAPGQGTTFTIVLPAYRADEERRGEPEETQATPPPEPRILLVCTQGRRSSALHKQLQEQGVYTALVTTPASAFTTLRDPHICNTLAVEYELDGANGWEFARKARGLRPDLNIFLLADPSHRVDVTQARNAGIDQVLVQPFDARDLETEAVKALATSNAAADRHGHDPVAVADQIAALGRHGAGAVTELWSPAGVEVIATERGSEEVDVETLESEQVEVWFVCEQPDDPAEDAFDDVTDEDDASVHAAAEHNPRNGRDS